MASGQSRGTLDLPSGGLTRTRHKSWPLVRGSKTGISSRKRLRSTGAQFSKMADKCVPANRLLSSKVNATLAVRSAPIMRWSSPTASRSPGTVSSVGIAATIHACRKYSRNSRSSTARADAMVAASANCCGRSTPSQATADTSSTPAKLPRASKIGAPAQVN